MKDLSIILPIYNEKESIEIVLKEWSEELKAHNIKYEFILCEDGSTDGTKKLLLKLKKKYPIVLTQGNKRKGYGKAIIDGLKSVKTEYILCIDSDGQCDPSDFRKFWQARKKADVITGWRINRSDPFQRKIFSYFFGVVFYRLFPTSIHDPSAPFKLFRQKTINRYLSYLLHLNEGFWWGFIGMSHKKKLMLYELPINHRPRINGSTKVYKSKDVINIATRSLFGLFRLKYQK